MGKRALESAETAMHPDGFFRRFRIERRDGVYYAYKDGCRHIFSVHVCADDPKREVRRAFDSHIDLAKSDKLVWC